MANALRNDHLAVGIDRRLRVVGLHEAVRTLHDRALGSVKLHCSFGFGCGLALRLASASSAASRLPNARIRAVSRPTPA